MYRTYSIVGILVTILVISVICMAGLLFATNDTSPVPGWAANLSGAPQSEQVDQQPADRVAAGALVPVTGSEQPKVEIVSFH